MASAAPAQPRDRGGPGPALEHHASTRGGRHSAPAPNASAIPQKERAGPPDVAPLKVGDTRYEAIHWGKARGLGQNGGYIAAIDAATGREKWLLKVYHVAYDEAREEDKQDIFITELSLDRTPGRLRIKNEKGDAFIVDVAKRRVVQGGRRRDAPPAAAGRR